MNDKNNMYSDDWLQRVPGRQGRSRNPVDMSIISPCLRYPGVRVYTHRPGVSLKGISR